MSVSQERSAGGPHAVPPLTMIIPITLFEMLPLRLGRLTAAAAAVMLFYSKRIGNPTAGQPEDCGPQKRRIG